MSEGEGKRADKIGAYAEQGNVYIDTLIVEQAEERAKLEGIPQNVPLRGATKFVGRDDELEKIHEQLQRRDRVAISAIAGMGGIGKTELAIQYAVRYAQEFPGGICWLSAKETDLVGKIFSFVRLCLHQSIPSELENKPLTLDQQFELCLQDWKPHGAVLMVLDDVSETTDFQSLVQKLPSRFRVLLTTRVRQLDASFFEVSLDVLAPPKSLELLTELIGSDRIQPEKAAAQQLCAWLGHLPLGLELVGRYVAAKPFLSLAQMQERLNIQHEAIAQRPQKYVMTGQHSVTAAFELSWKELNDKAQEMGQLLSLFAADAIPWNLVQQVTEAFEWTTQEMETARTELYCRSLLQILDQANFRLHPLVQEFLGFKLAQSEKADQVRATFVEALVAVTKEFPLVLALGNDEWCEQIIPHLETIAQTQLQYLSNEDLLTLTGSLGRFYKKQALYDSAESWYTKCLEILTNRIGDDHPINVISLSRLVNLHVSQSCLRKAEPLQRKTLRIIRQQLGENHPDYAAGLYILATLHLYQLSFSNLWRAIFLLGQALTISLKTLGWKHTDPYLIASKLAITLFFAIIYGYIVFSSILLFLKTHSLVNFLSLLYRILIPLIPLKVITSTRFTRFINRRLAILRRARQQNL